ncbi:MAG: ribosome maturation factor, partial [Proteobacteria bacterium]
DIFIVNIRMRPGNNIEIYLDADSGLPIEKIAKVNRRLYNEIEQSEIFPQGDFSLEVSSPGVDEPLGSMRQYKKNIGRTVAVSTAPGVPEKTGILKEVDENRVVLEIKVPKKKETITEEIPFSEITKTVVQIVF